MNNHLTNLNFTQSVKNFRSLLIKVIQIATEYKTSPMGITMQQNEILYLIKERIRVLSLLKEIYLKKQKSVFSEEKDVDDRLNELHKIFLGEMLTLEDKWRTFIKKLKSGKRIESNNTDVIISLTLHDDWVTQYFAYKDQLYQILSEIERIKKNSNLMASNEFPYFLRTPQASAPKSQHQNVKKRPEAAKLSLKKRPRSKIEKK